MALAFVLFKSNRSGRALLILIPVLAVHLIWSVAKMAIPFPSEAIVVFDQVFTTFVTGVTVLWLLADKIGKRNRFATFLLALLVMAVFAVTGLVSYGVSEFSQEVLVTILFLGIPIAVLLLGFVLAAWCCRKHFGGVRLNLWFLLWCVVICAAAFVGFMAIVMIFNDIPADTLLEALTVGAITGAICYLIILPYMILSLNNAFWHQRLYACLRLRSMTHGYSHDSHPEPAEATDS